MVWASCLEEEAAGHRNRHLGIGRGVVAEADRRQETAKAFPSHLDQISGRGAGVKAVPLMWGHGDVGLRKAGSRALRAGELLPCGFGGGNLGFGASSVPKVPWPRVGGHVAPSAQGHSAPACRPVRAGTVQSGPACSGLFAACSLLGEEPSVINKQRTRMARVKAARHRAAPGSPPPPPWGPATRTHRPPCPHWIGLPQLSHAPSLPETPSSAPPRPLPPSLFLQPTTWQCIREPSLTPKRPSG